MAAKINVRTYKGTRDFLPEQMVKRQFVIDKIINAFEKFGFEPLETPAMELMETLGGKYGDEGDKLLYNFEDRGGRQVGLRYDLTVPLSRVVAMHHQLLKPFKRYQIQPVWRADKPQKGRFREFYQCDVDIVGSN
ncbi:MAG: ATP phosphoribosyltransferase regulatory subunit, partial [Calditrichia bacterium]|nr:ATP phosphoribosyltransferase regulatory subunit [Calditrichia bacterium]